MSADEVEYYFDLLDDHRQIEDPDDPPSYDWTGGAPLAGGSKVSVSESAIEVLQKCGGVELARYLGGKIENDLSHRQELARQAILLLGVSSPLVSDLLRSSSAEMREAVVAALMPINWSMADKIPVILAPLLVDVSDPVVARVNDVLRTLGTFTKQLLEENLPAGMLPTMRSLLDRTQAESRSIRLEAYFYAICLSGAWSELASLLSTLDEDEVWFLIGIPRFDGNVVRSVIEIAPASRAILKAPIMESFRRETPCRRFSADRLASFAPDRDAFELILEELRCRPSAGIDIARFLKAEPSWMLETIEAAFLTVSECQVDALGLQQLVLSDLDAFVRALLAYRHYEIKLETLRKVFRCLPDVSVGDKLMDDVRSRAAAIQSEPK